MIYSVLKMLCGPSQASSQREAAQISRCYPRERFPAEITTSVLAGGRGAGLVLTTLIPSTGGHPAAAHTGLLAFFEKADWEDAKCKGVVLHV